MAEEERDSAWNLKPWIYDGDMNADHFSGELGFEINGDFTMVMFRAGGRTFCASVPSRHLRELLVPEKRDGKWRHGDWTKLRASGYAPDARLRILEPDCNLRWIDNYPNLYGSPTEAAEPLTPKVLS